LQDFDAGYFMTSFKGTRFWNQVWNIPNEKSEYARVEADLNEEHCLLKVRALIPGWQENSAFPSLIKYASSSKFFAAAPLLETTSDIL
jgi:hypothetical protein